MTATPPASPPPTSVAVAILSVIGAGAILSGMDATAKYLALGMPLFMVLWGRYFIHTALTFVLYTGQTRSLDFLRARRPGLQFLRAAALFGATAMMYVALTLMPLGDAAAIQFLAPVLMTAFSGLALGEKVGPRRWGAVVFGFIGVLLVARPGSGVFGLDALWPLGTAVLLAIYMMMTRHIRDLDSPASTTFYSTAVGAAVLSCVVPFIWQTLEPWQWGLMGVMGAAGALGHFLVVKAFHAAEASMLAPFTYAHVIAAIIWGIIVFEDYPSPWTLAGAATVIASGLYVWYREKQTGAMKAPVSVDD